METWAAIDAALQQHRDGLETGQVSMADVAARAGIDKRYVGSMYRRADKAGIKLRQGPRVDDAVELRRQRAIELRTTGLSLQKIREKLIEEFGDEVSKEGVRKMIAAVAQ